MVDCDPILGSFLLVVILVVILVIAIFTILILDLIKWRK